MNSPLVSIIIPCYNAEAFLATSIRSALNQTYQQREVVVIDDGSKDQSVEVLRSFGSSIRWETGPNRGGCAARNRGVALARGEIIQFLDADDWLYPSKLERQMSALIASPNTTPICDGELIDSGQIIQRLTAPQSCEDSFIPLLNGKLLTPSPLHRRSTLLQVGGFKESLPCSQERDLHLRLACHGWPLCRIAEPLFAVRRTSGSVSSSYERVLDQHLDIAYRAQQILVARNSWTEDKAHALAAFISRDARHYHKLGRSDKATHYFEAARAFHPSGGLDKAYGTLAQWAVRFISPIALERLLKFLR